jgi:hypothetical protein
MSDTTYKHWCYVVGDDTPFSIIASSTLFIHDLQELIKKRKSNLLQKVDASNLVLWKVRYLIFLVIISDITGDTSLAYGGYPCQAI